MKYYPIFKPFLSFMYEVDPYRELLSDFETYKRGKDFFSAGA